MSAILVLKMVSNETIASLLSFPIQERRDRYLPEDFVAEGERTDIDVAWQALHFLFTETLQDGEPPASYLLAGGTIIGPSVLAPGGERVPSSREKARCGRGASLAEVDRALNSQEIDAFARYLSAVTDEDLCRRFERLRSSMGEVYPGIWQGDPEGNLAYLLENFQELKEFVNAARERGLGLLLHFA